MGSGREPGVLDGQGWITLWPLSHRCSSATGQPGTLGQVAEPGYTSGFPTKLGSLHPCFGSCEDQMGRCIKGLVHSLQWGEFAQTAATSIS